MIIFPLAFYINILLMQPSFFSSLTNFVSVVDLTLKNKTLKDLEPLKEADSPFPERSAAFLFRKCLFARKRPQIASDLFKTQIEPFSFSVCYTWQLKKNIYIRF